MEGFSAFPDAVGGGSSAADTDPEQGLPTLPQTGSLRGPVVVSPWVPVKVKVADSLASVLGLERRVSLI